MTRTPESHPEGQSHHPQAFRRKFSESQVLHQQTQQDTNIIPETVFVRAHLNKSLSEIADAFGINPKQFKNDFWDIIEE